MPTDHSPQPIRRQSESSDSDAPSTPGSASPKVSGSASPKVSGSLTRHRGLATWGERLVPLEKFRLAASRRGETLEPDQQAAARDRFLMAREDGSKPEGPWQRIAVFGGIYNNHVALQALLTDAADWGAEAIYCLGDFGGFGPNPEKVWPLLEQGDVRSIQGNYEQSLSSGAEDCNCGYADPRDNHFAELSYRYTEQNCSSQFKEAMGALPLRRRVLLGKDPENALELLLIHGSPRRINEFLFESATPDPFLEVLLDQERADAILCTHTGMHWQRKLSSSRSLVNVGVIGRPANDGEPNVWYTRITADDNRLLAQHVPLFYDTEALAKEMRSEQLPEQFVETICSGWWTTCLEILPAKERAGSRY